MSCFASPPNPSTVFPADIPAMKQILILGGSYFVGRIFCIFASRTGEYEITLVNRGRQPVRRECVTELVCDRNDVERLRSEILPTLSGKHFDTLIDTCAYEPGQVSSILPLFAPLADQYLLLSTASVYSTEERSARRESDPLMEKPAKFDSNSEYVWKKVLLEQELREVAGLVGIPFTIFRPAAIFGPFNYAPRESWYIERMVKRQPIPVLNDAPARFQMVYAPDVANAMMLAAGNPQAYNRVFNLAAPEVITRALFYQALEKCFGEPVSRISITEEEASLYGLSLSLPVRYDELYDGSEIERTLSFSYTPFSESMQKTVNVFKNVYA